MDLNRINQMSVPNPRMNPEQITNKNMSIHLLRSKSPQFDPMNARMSGDNAGTGMFGKSKDKQQDLLKKDQEGDEKMEIKSDLVVSFRNLSDPTSQSNVPQQSNSQRFSSPPVLESDFNKANNVKNSFVPGFGSSLQNNQSPSDKMDMKIPIKTDISKVSLESFIKKTNQGVMKTTTSNVSNSEVVLKPRSPSAMATDRPISSVVESNHQRKTPQKDSTTLLDLPLTKSAKPKIPNPMSVNDTSKPPTNQSSESKPQFQKPKQPMLAEEVSPKRSNSEKIHVGIRGNKPDLFMENPKSMIKMLMSQSRFLPEFDSPKVIMKQYKSIYSFAVTTHKGIVRNYNEDRVSVLLNVQQNLQKDTQIEQGESYCLFSIFDGHGGYGCCNFLKDNLHNKLLETCDFKNATAPNLSTIYKQLDYQYIKSAIDGNHKFSGSCALTIVVGPKFGLAINVGDSRALCSRKNGTLVEDITYDHKPEATGEFNRVIKNGGELYRMSANQKTGEERYYFVKDYKEVEEINKIEQTNQFIIFGPWRVKPGGLSVSRTFGDVESKMQSLGGLNGTVVCDPELTTFNYDNMDFIVIGCDGVFDKLTSQKVSETVWETLRFHQDRYLADNTTYEQILSECVNNVLRRSMLSRSEDNLTVVLLCFRNLYS